MSNITQIPAPRVPLIDAKTGLMSREWFRFFNYVYEQLNPANYAQSSADVSYNEGGTGAVVRSVQSKLQESVSVKDFGAVGDGVTDDTAAIQAALNNLSSKGGCVELTNSGQYRIASNLNIPNGVILKGLIELPGKFVAGANSTAGFNLIGSSLFLASTATIIIKEGAGLRGINIIRYGMAFPSADASAYAGTAITIGGDDAYLGYCSITGFNQGIYSNGYQRPHFEWLYMDNQNGVEITACADITRLTNIHMWPFGVYPNGSTATFKRTGNAFYLHDTVDGPMLSNCFAIGYLNNFYFKNVSTILTSNCFADNFLPYANSSGWLFEGFINGFSSSGCSSWSSENGVIINTADYQYVPIAGFIIENCSANGVKVLQGNSLIFNAFIASCNAGVYVDKTSSIVDVKNNTFASITTDPIVINVSTNNVYIDQNINLASTTSSFVTSNDSIYQIASANPLPIVNFGHTFNVTGTTNFSQLACGWAQRKVTLIFNGILTVTSGTGSRVSMRLSGNANFTTSAGATLTLAHNGAQWFEIGRSA